MNTFTPSPDVIIAKLSDGSAVGHVACACFGSLQWDSTQEWNY